MYAQEGFQTALISMQGKDPVVLVALAWNMLNPLDHRFVPCREKIMIYVVQMPRSGRPHAWFAYDKEDFKRKVSADCQGSRVIYQVATARQVLSKAGLDPDWPSARTEYPEVFEAATRHGWGAALYRADYFNGDTRYTDEPIDEWEAYAAAIGHPEDDCRIYGSDESAVHALYYDPFYQERERFYAQLALREQLIALEVIAEDF